MKRRPPHQRKAQSSKSLVGDLTRDDLAEQIPLLAFEANHLRLLDRGKVGALGVDLDVRQEGVRREVPEAGRLLQALHDGLGMAVAEHITEPSSSVASGAYLARKT